VGGDVGEGVGVVVATVADGVGFDEGSRVTAALVIGSWAAWVVAVLVDRVIGGFRTAGSVSGRHETSSNITTILKSKRSTPFRVIAYSAPIMNLAIHKVLKRFTKLKHASLSNTNFKPLLP
jgi:hypothetical protein